MEALELDTKHQLNGTNVYNMDESGPSTVHKPSKVVCGQTTNGVLTSAERGLNPTRVFATNAAGNFVPLMLIFKRKRIKTELQDGAPIGAVALSLIHDTRIVSCFASTYNTSSAI